MEESMPAKTIYIKGAREHNLKNIDIELPRDKLIVFTGLSGSGKSAVQQLLLECSGKCAENVARAKMNPYRFSLCGRNHLFPIESGKTNPSFLPLSTVF